MVEKILEKIVNEMSAHLYHGQLEHLSNVLYVNFHGIEVQEQHTELIPSGIDGDTARIKMFVASKKAVNRQDNTLRQYTREIYNMLNFGGYVNHGRIFIRKVRKQRRLTLHRRG